MNQEAIFISTQKALDLARNCKYGPLPKPTDPVPSVKEAIDIINDYPTMRTCNWLTGQAAVAVLKKSLTEGPKSIVLVVEGIGVVA
jgi:hypothetical protein